MLPHKMLHHELMGDAIRESGSPGISIFRRALFASDGITSYSS